jgi:Uma2 family endonuclease
VSDDEYLAQERASATKHELVNGEVLAMAGGSPVHNLVMLNIGGTLRALLETKPCIVLPSDQRIHVPATGLYTYPDVAVICGRPERHPRDADTLLNPLVLFEVLSPTTEAYDRGAKFAHYRAISSLQEYVLVASLEKRVEHYRRLEGGRWVLTETTGEDGVVALPALGVDLPLRAIYEKLEILTQTA